MFIYYFDFLFNMSNQYLNNKMFKKITNESTNIDKNLINAAYRRFLLRNCNTKQVY